jgi:hypothetical protein
MTRILFIGQEPETVDFSDPALPPGFDAAKINAGIAIAVQTIEERGWQVDPCMITPDEAGLAQLDRQLRARRYDCVVIGGGLRLPPTRLRHRPPSPSTPARKTRRWQPRGRSGEAQARAGIYHDMLASVRTSVVATRDARSF